ncbi:RNA polymerase III subunit C82 [Lithohypha guttulata]|uniref:DNA-directed RNA polymerase III subunit RPC3 n=1 Tax=Lithohypha guttulata TaxID=1690604 RepID=A0AAN7T4T8_9EURO|nr:RNA polymerase III subunit C82 [Lithohypha guttulata]
MTTSPNFKHLCCELVEDYYGDFYRTIFECLASARFTAPQVAQKCHLPLRQARAGLAGLVQLRLVYHHTPRDAATVYSANLTNAYDIIRTGRLAQEAARTHGDLAATIVATACELGFSTINELRDRVLLGMGSDEDSKDASTVDKLISKLLDDHFLAHLRKAHFGEVHDVRREIELKLLSPAAIAKLTGTKAKQEHQENINRNYDSVVTTSTSEHGYTNGHYLQSHRQQNGNGMEGVIMNGHHTTASTLIQPNFYKIVEIAQIEVVGDQARKTFGKRGATILKCAIRQAAVPDIWSKPPPSEMPSHQINTYKLLEEVNDEQQREEGRYMSHTNGTLINGNGNHHNSESAPEVSMDDLENELMLLTESIFHSWLEDVGRSTYQIHKGPLDLWTRTEEILRILDSRLDPPAPRILRILIDKGKLEERTLQEIGLLGAKELRQSLSMLKQMGYLELQEVPRNPARQPNQTVFLWSYEQGRVATLTLEHVYTAMVRLLQLLKLERKKLAGTLTKIEREDVKGKEEEMLAPGEFIVLSRFRRVESWIWGEIQRLDFSVAILRDI